ncbi:MAG: hypothetical protein O3C13_09355 [Bacteroidetes bacterium]|nr:hypothetical protein [Bacteroidota bacterium]
MKIKTIEEKSREFVSLKRKSATNGGEIKYAIYEDYHGNDIKTENFKKGMSEDEIKEPKGYMIADFDQDEDGVMYVRFQQN